MAKMHIVTSSRVGDEQKLDSSTADISIELLTDQLGYHLGEHLRRVLYPQDRRTRRPSSIRDVTVVVSFETQEV